MTVGRSAAGPRTSAVSARLRGLPEVVVLHDVECERVRGQRESWSSHGHHSCCASHLDRAHVSPFPNTWLRLLRSHVLQSSGQRNQGRPTKIHIAGSRS